jgi:hypothetical protein
MEFARLLQVVRDEPVFETGLLLAGDVDPFDVRKQLSRWTAAGKVYQLRRGLYSLAPPYRKVIPHPFLIANRLQPGAYVSLQSALSYYGLIPEAVYVTTSISSGRTEFLHTPLGEFDFRHVLASWHHDYRQVDLGNNQKAFVAAPEKALLDLIHLTPVGDSPAYLNELRLQALEQLDLGLLHHLANEAKKPRLIRAASVIQQMAEEEAQAYEIL